MSTWARLIGWLTRSARHRSSGRTSATPRPSRHRRPDISGERGEGQDVLARDVDMVTGWLHADSKPRLWGGDLSFCSSRPGMSFPLGCRRVRVPSVVTEDLYRRIRSTPCTVGRTSVSPRWCEWACDRQPGCSTALVSHGPPTTLWSYSRDIIATASRSRST
jgi:hypothetical protein